ncbi:peptide-methionine (R)-S-oxide reductase MsrB [Rubellimicrobium aerolatum]|uniref:peptide-methionine (R)-S-oxide reductase n=1 Tax=Rubellimicrobium aerolatum TaxID=490979 RepID=A0ABW0S709_9RHOB|nr:peptide-methionine (R)-S-oxide reductase MsrB [Rubellimicrobium aerolatum]MBP1804522.1 peptide-methionine (R)-S-oxide reductase [Rubellimicrobium aerolatum]
MEKVVKSDEEWQRELSPEAYRVTRGHGTERAFSHPGFPEGEGTFRCVACGAPLFDSETKYESGSGWPSFWQPIDGVESQAVEETVDRSHGMTRTEVHCARCAAHLGHVFPDGPKPTGLRYCINGAALTFEPEE